MFRGVKKEPIGAQHYLNKFQVPNIANLTTSTYP